MTEWDGFQDEYIEFPGVRLSETRFYRDVQEVVRVNEWRSIALVQLTELVGEVPETVQARISALTFEQLGALGKALLRFQNLSDLEAWLETNK